MFTLPVTDDGGQHHHLQPLGLGQHLIDHLADGLSGQRDVVLRATGLTDPGKHQPQVVVDFGDGAHRRARVVRGRFLLDGDGGRQPFDMVDIGFFHQGEKLAGVGGERFDVTALPLGIEGIESE